MRIFFFILIVILSFASQTLAQVAVLEIKKLDKDKIYSFQPYLEVWIDSSAVQTIATVLAPQIQQKFVPFDLKKIDFTAKSYWLKCQINNLNQDSLRLGLQIGMFERVDIYRLHTDSQQYAKEIKPILQRIFKKGSEYDYLTLPPSRSVLYFHITREQDFSVVMHKYIFSGMSFLGEDFTSFWVTDKKKIEVLTLLYFGGLVLLFCYNLVLFVTLSDKTFLLYLLSLFFWGVFIFGLKDLYTLWVAPAPPKYIIWIASLPLIVSSIFQLLFTRSFLKLNDWLKWANYLILSLVGIQTILLLSFSLPIVSVYRFAFNLAALVLVISYITQLVIAFFVLIHQKHNNRFYFVGNIVFIISVIVIVLDILRIIPSTIYSANAIFLGSLVEMSLFSLALTDKISSANKALAEQKLARAKDREKLIEEKRHELELKVKERTQELQASNEALAQINKTKDKLFSIISHDLRSPLASLKGTIDILDPEVLNENELAFIKSQLSHQFEATDNMLQNLLLWASSQLQGEIIKPTKVHLSIVVAENIDFLDKIATSKKIILSKEVPDSIQVIADENHLRAILRNLLANAIKFTSKGGRVTVTANIQDAQVRIAIHDTGIGISEERKKRLFTNILSTKGTGGEKGSGLGLLLVSDLVEKNGGKIWVESEIGKGSTFYFTLPAANLS